MKRTENPRGRTKYVRRPEEREDKKADKELVEHHDAPANSSIKEAVLAHPTHADADADGDADTDAAASKQRDKTKRKMNERKKEPEEREPTPTKPI